MLARKMWELNFLVALSLGMIFSLILTPKVIDLAFKLDIVDKPDKRKVHTQPKPRLGGLSVFSAYWLALIICYLIKPTAVSDIPILGIAIGTTIGFVIGLLDDKFDLKPVFKLIGQIVVGLTFWLLGVRIEFVSNLWNCAQGTVMYLSPFMSLTATVFWVVVVMNALNLIDGLDGLLAGLTSIISLAIAVILYLKARFMLIPMLGALIGVSLGFLRYNFHPAEIFLGDSGSMFIGSLLAGLSILGPIKGFTLAGLVPSILIFGVPLSDTFLAFFRRLLAGRSPFTADKEHIHHKLLNLGLTQVQAVLLIYLISTFLSGAAIAITLKSFH